MTYLLFALAYALVGFWVYGYVTSTYAGDDEFEKTFGENGAAGIVLLWPLLVALLFGEWVEDHYGRRR